MKLTELSYIQKCHLVWRIDNKTGVGLITAQRIAKGEFGDITIEEVFIKCGKTPHSAKIHSKKVRDFTKDP